MIWYLINIFGIIISWFARSTGNAALYDPEIEEEYRRKRTCVVGTINWIILSGLRNLSVGADTEQYSNRYLATEQTSWTELLQRVYEKYILGQEIKDPGYSILEKVAQIFGINYRGWLILIAVIFFVAMGIWIYKYSEDVLLSYILFSTLFYGFFAVTGMRQTIATAFVVFIGFELIRNRKLVLFIILTLLCSTVHQSVLCFIPFYWLYRIKNKIVTVSCWWIPIVLSFIFRNRLIAFLQLLVGYENYGQYEGASAGTFLYLLIALAMLTTVFYSNMDFEESEEANGSLNALYTACIFSSMLLINQSTMRVVQYYSLFLMLLLPRTKRIFSEESKNLYTGICVALMVLLLISNNPKYVFLSW